eukprot:4049132-Pleurochrysis_carterae.AAC.1
MSTPRTVPEKLSIKSRSANLCSTLRATWRVVHNRHPGTSFHLPDAGDGRSRQPRARLHGEAQHADEGIEFKTQWGSQLIAYSDSDWA